MSTKYFNDAIIGNETMVASFTKKGELLRIFYPSKDYRQLVDFIHTGVKINDSSMIYLHNDINNEYKQYYTENTNILNTEIINTYFELKITQTDFVPINKNIIIKKYVFQNNNTIELNIDFLIYSKLISDINNQVSGYYKENSLIQYMHDYTFGIFSKQNVLSYQINGNSENISSGIISGKDYIGMSSDSSISYNIGVLKPGETKTLEIYLYLKENQSKNGMERLENSIENIKKIDTKKEYEDTKKYWKRYFREHNAINLAEPTNILEENMKKIYQRTILLFPLLVNTKTGGISAGVEVDENSTRCGRYSYCWTRDAIFITTAMDLLKMEKETEKFYLNFCRNTQSKNGMWEQRFYTDGNLAPSWGYQIDETASVIYGVYKHYEHTKNLEFLENSFHMCEKATEFLIKYIDDILNGTNKFKPSYDLWEENEGIHTYSLSSIYSAFQCMLQMFELVKPSYEANRLKLEKINKQSLILQQKIRETKEYILKNLYNSDKKSFVRNKDNKIDISILGLSTPFELFSPKEKKIQNTVERLNLSIRTYTGGYLRYEGDKYIGGNPWVIANLWLANYYIDAGEKKKAKECLEFVITTCTEHGFLAEQIDNSTMKAAWVIGLGWSHALFIIVLNKLMN